MLCSITSKSISEALTDWFNDFGIPEKIRTDGGPQFRSEFQEFCKSLHIHHELSSPYHPESNGHAESAVKAMKKLLQKCPNWNSFRSALLEWRNVPRSDGLSPAQWFFGRQQRTRTPAHPHVFSRISDSAFLDAEERREEEMDQVKGKAKKAVLPPFKIGEKVRVQDPKSKQWNSFAIITDIRRNKRSYVIEFDNGRTSIRNRRFLRKANI
jgi:hypothetical protein